MKKSLSITSILLLGLVMLVGISLPRGRAAAAPGLPTASVSGVSVAPNPVCAPDSVTVAANISGAFDTNSSSTGVGRCNTDKDRGVIVGYSRTDTVTTVTVTNKLFSVSASDGQGHSDSQTLDASSGSALYSGLLGIGPDGRNTMTVSAFSSEDVTTQVDTVNNTWPASAGSCTGAPASSTIAGTPNTVSKQGSSASSNGTYQADLNPPVITLLPNPGVVGNNTQGGFSIFNLKVLNGSPSQGFTVNITMTSTANPSVILTGTTTDSFGPLNGSGKEDFQHELMKVDIPCDAPVGDYIVTIELVGTNSCGSPYDEFYGSPLSVTIGPGLTLTAGELVIADFGVEGYHAASCFTATASGSKVNTYAGSFHTATLLTSQGPCAGISSLSGVVITQTIPPGFAPFTTKPLVGTHVFYPAGAGLHYPGPEITLKPNDVKYTKNVDNSWTVTINLPGSYPASGAIYARTHVAQVLTSAPWDGTPYIFSNTATANSGALSSSASATLTKDNSCVQ